MIPYYQYRFIQVYQENCNLQKQQKQSDAPPSEQVECQTNQKPLKKLKPPKKVQRRFWNERDNRLYLEFLQKNEKYFQMSVSERMSEKPNVRMSSHIKYKSTKQCRSHHQKMLLKCKTISGIIDFLRNKLKKTIDDQQLQQNEENWLDLLISQQQRIYYENCTSFHEKNWLIEDDCQLQ